MRILTQKLFQFGLKFAPMFYRQHTGQSTVIQHINDGTRMKIRVNTFDKQALYEVWKLKEYETEHFVIRPGDVIIDIGAHIGTFSVWAAQKAVSGQVFSFEPDPENYALLAENKNLNGLTNLHILNSAVSQKRGQVKLFTSDYHNMTHSFFEEGTREHTLVDTVSLADILEEYGLEKVHYLKIDAEGAEYQIILNTPPSVLRRIDKIFIEYHDYLDHGYNYRDLTGYLSENGFQTETGASAFHRHILKMGLIKARRI
jgi:FkbM family methyltransferase